jgi:DNA mismatch repair ATPase MutL
VPSLEAAVAAAVHNALDALAKTVTVTVTITTTATATPALSFEVHDDGDGIAAEDLAAVFVRHSTTKRDVSHSHNHSHHRGEALASMACSALRVEITSRVVGAPRAFTCAVMRGVVCPVMPAVLARPVGTALSVVDLFFRFPVRGLAAVSSGSLGVVAAVRAVLQAIAVAHPGVVLTLFDASRGVQIFGTRRRTSMLDTFLDIHGAALATATSQHQLKAIASLCNPRFRWCGWVSAPLPPGHPSKDLQLVFVNHHVVLATAFHKLANAVFRRARVLVDCTSAERTPHDKSLASRHRRHHHHHPVFLLSLECADDEFDVSFGPTMTEIEFADWATPLRLLEATLTHAIFGVEGLSADEQIEFFGVVSPASAVSISLSSQSPSLALIPAINVSPNLTATALVTHRPHPPRIHRSSSEPSSSSSSSLVDLLDRFLGDTRECESDQEVPSLQRKISSSSASFLSDDADAVPPPPVANQITPAKRQRVDGNEWKSPQPLVVASYSQLPERPIALTKESLAAAIVLGQVDRKYIIATHCGVVLAFDQHAVHERVRLEQLEDAVFGLDGRGRNVGHRFGTWRWPLSLVAASRFGRYAEQVVSWGWSACLVSASSSSSTTSTASLHVSRIPVVGDGAGLQAEELNEFLQALEDSAGSAATRPPAITRILAMRACRTAIKFGTGLCVSECSELLRLLSRCRFPFQCAHGRPNVYPLADCSRLAEFRLSR